MKRQMIAAAATLILSASSAALAGDIYKWVDEDGNVHYGDKPVATQSTQLERLDIDSKPTDNVQITAQTQARAQARTERRDAEAAAAAEGPSADELQAQADERRQQCETSRSNMQRMVTSRRLYKEDESGARVSLDESEMQATRQRVEDEISEFCG